MKQWSFIFGFLLAVLMLSGEETALGEADEPLPAAAAGTVIEKDARTDMRTQIAVLSKELKNNNLLAPRRTITPFSQGFPIKHFDRMQFVMKYFRLRSGNTLAKVQERESYINIIHFSSLFCSMARHVFAMRKLLI